MNLKGWMVKLMLVGALILSFGLVTLEAATLSIGSQEAKPGELVTVNIELSNAPGESISSMNFDIIYDPKQLELNKIAGNKILTDTQKNLSSSSTKAGEVRVLIMGLNQQVIPDGALATAAFTVKEDAKPADLMLNISNAVASNPKAGSISLELKPGKITVKRAR